MCAEKDPITCHRTILICQHLVPFNLEIGHILEDGSLEYHEDLEKRLLKLHHLQEREPEGQLSLFATDPMPELTQANDLKKRIAAKVLKLFTWKKNQGNSIRFECHRPSNSA